LDQFKHFAFLKRFNYADMTRTFTTILINHLRESKMLTGKFRLDKKARKEVLLVEWEVKGRREWRDINELKIADQNQIIASNSDLARYIDFSKGDDTNPV
jgi:hypothetical protein